MRKPVSDSAVLMSAWSLFHHCRAKTEEVGESIEGRARERGLLLVVYWRGAVRPAASPSVAPL